RAGVLHHDHDRLPPRVADRAVSAGLSIQECRPQHPDAVGGISQTVGLSRPPHSGKRCPLWTEKVTTPAGCEKTRHSGSTRTSVTPGTVRARLVTTLRSASSRNSPLTVATLSVTSTDQRPRCPL